MLNKNVVVRVTRAIGSFDEKKQCNFDLNFGRGLISGERVRIEADTYIMGIHHPVKSFDGRIIAAIRRNNGGYAFVAASRNARFINYDIMDAIAFAEPEGSYTLDCLYENSCGAVVYRFDGKYPVFLLIKNRRSSNWGFPKGHVERGETFTETALREVHEETGVHIKLIDGFEEESKFQIGGKVDKKVTIFLGYTEEKKIVKQEEEIEDYAWLDYSTALKNLKFDNDKLVLRRAGRYMNQVLNIPTGPQNEKRA